MPVFQAKNYNYYKEKLKKCSKEKSKKRKH